MKILQNVPDSKEAKLLKEMWNEGLSKDNKIKEVFVYESKTGTIYEPKLFTQKDIDYFDSQENIDAMNGVIK